MIWNPYTEGYFENPYPHLKACRENNPIQKGYADLQLFFNYNDVNFLLKSNDFQTSELSNYLKSKEPYIFSNTSMCPHLSEATKLWPMYLNGEKHKIIKNVFSKALYDIDYESMIIISLEESLFKYKNQNSFDLVEFCSFFIFLVIKQLFGIENYESVEKFEIYSNMLAKSQDIFIPKQTYQEINEWYLWGKKIYSNSNFKENLKQNMRVNKFEFDEPDIDSIMSVASMAAFETSKDNLSMAFIEILKNPTLIDFVEAADSNQLNIFIEELLRYSAPLQYTVRTNNSELILGNQTIPANTKLYLCLASANRDPVKFENPEFIDPYRKNNNHLSFGAGLHFCAGAPIARQELKICLKPMVKFLKNFKVVPESIKWSKQIFMRTLKTAQITKKVL